MKKIKHILFIMITLTSLFGQAQDTFDAAKYKFDKIKNKKNIHSIHEDNMGKIIFSNERIPFKKMDVNESKFIQTTKFGEQLFLRQYWNKTVEEAYSESFKGSAWDNAALFYEVFINGEKINDFIDYTISGKQNIITWYTTWADISIPSNSHKTTYLYSDVLIKSFTGNKQLLKNNCTVKLVCSVYNGATSTKGGQLAEGEITIDFSGADLSIIPNKASNNYPPCMPTPKMEDKTLEQKLLNAAIAKGWTEEHILAVINTSDYTIVRNAITRSIEGRTIGANVAAKRDGKCFYQRFTFYQQYDGNNYSGNWKLQGVGEQIVIPCSCLTDF